MKVILLRKAEKPGQFSSAGIVKETVSTAPNGMNIAQMRARIRILDALDASNDDELYLEDADYEVLSEVIKSMQWLKADKIILQIIDDILGAKKPDQELSRG